MLLYCLRCKTPGRWYVGQTKVWRMKKRLHEQLEGSARWTKIHGVDRLVWTRRVSPVDVDRLEDWHVANIMAKHGWNSCRGGLFNLASDVDSMPPWVQPIYRERRNEIDAATEPS